MNRFQKKLLRAVICQIVIAAGAAIAIKTYTNHEYSLFIGWVVFLSLNATFFIHAQKFQLAKIGCANYITLFRGVCIVVMSGFIFTPYTPVPVALYMIVVLLDVVDGYVARRTRSVSKFGEKIDIECDAMGMLIATILLLQYEKVPQIYIAVGAIRYLFVLHTYIVSKKQSLSPLPPSNYRRFIAGLHMVFIIVSFFLPASIVYVNAYIFAIPFIVTFLRDWLCVLNIINIQNDMYQKVSQINRVVVFKLLPLVVIGAMFIQTPLYSLLFAFLVLGQRSKMNEQTISVLVFALSILFTLEHQQMHLVAFSSILIVTLGSKIRK